LGYDSTWLVNTSWNSERCASTTGTHERAICEFNNSAAQVVLGKSQDLQLQVILAEEENPRASGGVLAVGYRPASVKLGRCAALFAMV